MINHKHWPARADSDTIRHSLTINQQFSWTGGTLGGLGTTEALGGLVINGASSTPTLDTRTLDNWAAAVWAGSRGLALNNRAVLNNEAGATFDTRPYTSF